MFSRPPKTFDVDDDAAKRIYEAFEAFLAECNLHSHLIVNVSFSGQHPFRINSFSVTKVIKSINNPSTSPQ